MKRLLSLFIALTFLAGAAGVSLAADPGTAGNSTINADKTVKKSNSKTNKKTKSSKKTKTKTKSKKKKKPGAV